MTNLEIETKLAGKIQDERRITKEILELLILAEERKLFAERGYPSMFEWLTKKFGYSEGAANRRISAARLLRAVPEAKAKIESGDLNLTTMAKAQSVIRAQEKAVQRKVTSSEKLDALKRIENESSVKAERTLLALFPEAATQMKQEKVTTLSEDSSRLNTTVSNEVMERFKQVRDLLSHKLPNATFIEVADYLFQKLLAEESTAAAAKHCVRNENKTLTPKTRRVVLRQAQCTYRDSVTGKICGSTHLLQVDHKIPKALGGDNRSENLRPMCAVHNRLMAEKLLGHKRANQWRKYDQLVQDFAVPRESSWSRIDAFSKL